MTCHELLVPADHDDPSGESYALHVTRLLPRQESQGLPIIVLLGGPGDRTEHALQHFDPSFVDSLGHELVLFDQRGAGRSEPFAQCNEITARDLDPADIIAEEIRRCTTRLANEGVDVSTLTTFQSAGDVDLLRRALGFDQVVLYGISYGTELALSVLRDFSNGVAGVVLDSTAPPHVNLVEELGPGVNATLTRLITACAEDPECRASYPALEQEVAETTSTLPLPWSDAPGGELTAAGYGSILYKVQARSAEPLVHMPRLIRRLYEDTLSGAISNDPITLGAVNERLPRDAMFYGIRCSSAQYADPIVVEEKLLSLRPALRDYFKHGADVTFSSCTHVPVRTVSRGRFSRVESSVPALFLVAPFDTLTPPSWARDAQESLRRSTIVELDRAGHGALLSDSSGCAKQLFRRFTDDPGGTLDIGCAE